MCGRSFVRGGAEYVPGRHRGPFGLAIEKLSPGARIVVALSVLAPVALSGVALAFTPVWWIFTTYFWVAFPAFGILGSGIAGMSAGRPARISERDLERELLEALREHGALSAAGVASETSMTVEEADKKLKKLANGGHLEVRVRGGALFYALWESDLRIEAP